MIKDFIREIRGGICGVMGNIYIKTQSQSQCQSQSHSRNQNRSQIQTQSHSNRSIWYIDANKFYGYALMQKLPYKYFSFTDTTLDEVLNSPDDSDYGYWLICVFEYTNECKDRSSNFQLLPYGREGEYNELGCKQRPKTAAKSKKLLLDQNNKYI